MTGARTQVNLHLDPATIAAMRKRAQSQGVFTAELLRRAWACYLACADENLPEGYSLAIVDTSKSRNKIVRYVKFAG